MELKKISDELANNVLGDGRFHLFGGNGIDLKEIRKEFSHFVERFPYAQAIRRANNFQRRNDAEDSAVVFAKLADAVRQAKGFSFVRMGDGEGRFVGAAREYPHLFRQSKRIAKGVWYKYSDPPCDEFYDTLEDAYANASIVGYVPPYRVTLEAENLWYGYFGCVCGNEFIYESCSHNIAGYEERLVRNWANVGLTEQSEFAKLLQSTRVCVITCHTDKAPFIAKFGLTDVEHIVIAPEAHGLLKNRSGYTKLFPDQYLKILDNFAASDSQLYVIGAGVFAKLFCERLRQLGRSGLI